MNRIPKPGEFYRDIENKLYQIMTAAEYTETGEMLVIYQALYGTYPIFAMPLLQFNRKADKEKSSRADQEYQFEPVKFLPRKHSLQELKQEEFLDEESEGLGELSFQEVSFDEESFEEMSFEEESFHEKSFDEDYFQEKSFGEESFQEVSFDEESLENRPFDEKSKTNASEAIEWLERFLDADRYEKQLEVLAQMRGKVGKRELDSICLVLGIPASSGDEDSQIFNIKKHLETRMRYDNRRLR